jgi:transcriptional regulator with XRE-family HTH domain
VVDNPEIAPRRRALAETLRGLRDAAGLDQRELARRAGWSQPKVSRIENGRTLPSASDIETWIQATGVGADQHDHLVDLAQDVATEATAWRVLLGRGYGRKQQAVAELERAAQAVRHFQPAVVPGLLQTAEYTRRIVTLWKPTATTEEISGVVSGRMERQQILYNRARQFEFIITEGALRWRPGPPEVLLAQLGQIRALSSLENVHVGVIPFASEAPAIFMHGFIYYEGSEDIGTVVTVETLTAELQIHEPSDVAMYTELLGRLRASALWGDDALALIRTIMAEQ